MALDLYKFDEGILGHDRCDCVENTVAFFLDDCFVDFEENPLLNHDLILGDDHLFLWAAIFVFYAIFEFRLLRAEVFIIGNTIFVRIDDDRLDNGLFGTTILISIAIHVFGLQGTFIVHIEDLILVIIEVRAPVSIFELITVFGLVQAFVVRILDAIAISVVVGVLAIAVSLT